MNSGDSTDHRSVETVWEVRLPAPPEMIEVATDQLWSAGATAVEERGSSGVSMAVATVQSEPVARSIATTLDALVRSSGSELGPVEVVKCEVEMLELWREHARWRRLTPHLAVGPSWVDPPPCARSVAIEPAGSFGLGDHPTTALVAGEVVRLVRPGFCVVDLGTGSGTLAIIAVLRGAQRVVAIDISPAAVDAAEANVLRAGVGRSVDVVLDGSGVAAREAFDGGADVVLANILAPEIGALASNIDAAAAPQARIVLSGFPEQRISVVLAAFPSWREERRCLSGAWVAVTLRRR
ncbi:MAG: 50S ribosomal protein L11 methyltransferase [Ilumatobacteraceae bacterium]